MRARGRTDVNILGRIVLITTTITLAAAAIHVAQENRRAAHRLDWRDAIVLPDTPKHPGKPWLDADEVK